MGVSAWVLPNDDAHNVPNQLEAEAFVRAALESLPEGVRGSLSNVAFIVEEQVRPAKAKEVGIHGHGTLLGLYEGVALPERSVSYSAIPDKVTLFTEALERECIVTGKPFEDVVRKTVWHEVGHHLGLDDDELHERGL